LKIFKASLKQRRASFFAMLMRSVAMAAGLSMGGKGSRTGVSAVARSLRVAFVLRARYTTRRGGASGRAAARCEFALSVIPPERNSFSFKNNEERGYKLPQKAVDDILALGCGLLEAHRHKPRGGTNLAFDTVRGLDAPVMVLSSSHSGAELQLEATTRALAKELQADLCVADFVQLFGDLAFPRPGARKGKEVELKGEHGDASDEDSRERGRTPAQKKSPKGKRAPASKVCETSPKGRNTETTQSAATELTVAAGEPPNGKKPQERIGTDAQAVSDKPNLLKRLMAITKESSGIRPRLLYLGPLFRYVDEGKPFYIRLVNALKDPKVCGSHGILLVVPVTPMWQEQSPVLPNTWEDVNRESQIAMAGAITVRLVCGVI
jgi:hypothetical protein